MATPLLKKTSTAAPSVRLKASGTVPSSAPRLKNVNGQAIAAKKTAPLARSKPQDAKPADPAPVETVVAAPAPSSVPEPAQEPAEATPPPAVEQPPAPQPEAASVSEPPSPSEDAASAAAQAEYERQMAEYNRQMEEYNRQMEEYNRQVAELQHQQAAAAQAGSQPAPVASVPAAAPAAALKPAAVKPGVVKTGGLKRGLTKAAKPAVKKSSTPESNVQEAPEEETPETDVSASVGGASAVDNAYLEQLRKAAEKPSIWKRKGFWVATVAFVAFASVCGVKVMQEKAIQARAEQRNARILALLKRAQQINMSGVESLADAKKKNVDVHCSLQDASFLMDVVVNPNMKDEKGKPMLGGNPDGVAQLACLLLGITAEENAESAKMIFDRLEKEVKQIKPSLYRWLIQRLAVADIKDVNGKLLHLTEVVSKLPAKGFARRDEVLSYIWETMGLRITEKDIPIITDLLKDPEMNSTLATTLARCLSNVIDLMDDPGKKKELGDKIFDLIPESRRAAMASALGRACSPKALAYYKQMAQDPAKWRNIFDFFANYQDDSVVEFLTKELRPKAAGDAKKEKQVQAILEAVLCQNRDRKPAEAQKLIEMIYDKLNTDTAEWGEVNAKTDKDSAEFVGEDSPQYAKLMKKREDIEAARKQKLSFVRAMRGMFDWPWVVQALKKLGKDEQDGEISGEISRTLEQLATNRENDKALREKYRERTGQ